MLISVCEDVKYNLYTKKKSIEIINILRDEIDSSFQQVSNE